MVYTLCIVGSIYPSIYTYNTVCTGMVHHVHVMLFTLTLFCIVKILSNFSGSSRRTGKLYGMKEWLYSMPRRELLSRGRKYCEKKVTGNSLPCSNKAEKIMAPAIRRQKHVSSWRKSLMQQDVNEDRCVL